MRAAAGFLAPLVFALTLLAACSQPISPLPPSPSVLVPRESVSSGVGAPIPSHAPVSPRPRTDTPFRGLATWVDVYDHDLWGDPAAAVSAMQSQGVRTLYLQTSNYSRPYDLNHKTELAMFIDAAHAQNLQVVAWYLPSLTNLPKDLERSLATIQFTTPSGQTFDGFGLDIESQELDPPGKRTEALLSLSAQIRAAAPDFPLAAITPSPVTLQTPPHGWPDFPWAGLNEYFDVFIPMEFIASNAHGRKEVEAYISLSAEILRGATGDVAVPIAPVGEIAVGISAPEAKGFVAAIRREDLIGGGLYDFRTTTDPAVWEALRKIAG